MLHPQQSIEHKYPGLDHQNVSLEPLNQLDKYKTPRKKERNLAMNQQQISSQNQFEAIEHIQVKNQEKRSQKQQQKLNINNQIKNDLHFQQFKINVPYPQEKIQVSNKQEDESILEESSQTIFSNKRHQKQQKQSVVNKFLFFENKPQQKNISRTVQVDKKPAETINKQQTQQISNTMSKYKYQKGKKIADETSGERLRSKLAFILNELVQNDQVGSVSYYSQNNFDEKEKNQKNFKQEDIQLPQIIQVQIKKQQNQIKNQQPLNENRQKIQIQNIFEQINVQDRRQNKQIIPKAQNDNKSSVDPKLLKKQYPKQQQKTVKKGRKDVNQTFQQRKFQKYKKVPSQPDKKATVQYEQRQFSRSKDYMSNINNRNFSPNSSEKNQIQNNLHVFRYNNEFSNNQQKNSSNEKLSVKLNSIKFKNKSHGSIEISKNQQKHIEKIQRPNNQKSKQKNNINKQKQVKKTETVNRNLNYELTDSILDTIYLDPQNSIYKARNKINFKIQSRRKIKTQLDNYSQITQQQLKFKNLLQKRQENLAKRVKDKLYYHSKALLTQISSKYPNTSRQILNSDTLEDAVDQKRKEFFTIQNSYNSIQNNLPPNSQTPLKYLKPYVTNVNISFNNRISPESNLNIQSSQFFQQKFKQRPFSTLGYQLSERQPSSSDSSEPQIYKKIPRRQQPMGDYSKIKRAHMEYNKAKHNLNAKEKYIRLKQLLNIM